MGIYNHSWQSCRPLWFRIPRLLRVIWILGSLAKGPFRRRWRFDPTQIRALLLVRDLHFSLPALVDGLLVQGIVSHHIVLIDSGSTHPACLETLSALEQRGCRWIRLAPADLRYGPYASWKCPALQREIRSWRYPFIVSDTDLAFPTHLPADWLYRLFDTLNFHRGVPKTALPLQIEDITIEKSAAVQSHELGLAQSLPYRLCSRIFLPAVNNSMPVFCPTDTTLSLYRPSLFFSTFSIRLPLVYSIRHLPWYAEFVDSCEFKYYQSHKLSLFGEWS